MKRLVLAGLLLLPGCATTSESDDLCSAVFAGIVVLPCLVAYGVGCVVGGGTRCCEGDDAAPAAASSTSLAEAPLPAAREAVDAAY